MTIMKRRLGVYSSDVPPIIHNHDDLIATERRLPRRKALLPTDHNSRSPARRRNSGVYDEPTIGKNGLRRISSESIMIEGFENKESKSTVKQKVVYLNSSPSDVIFGSTKKLGKGQTSIEIYTQASFSRRYSEAETQFEKSLIMCSILESIKDRGGKLLRESTSESKQGMYYEINDWSAMRKIKDVCALMNDSSHRHTI